MNLTFRSQTALTAADARHRNLAAVFEAVRDRPGRSRSEIGAGMPFSLQTMTNVVSELLDIGLLEETDHAGASDGGRGRGNPHRGLRISAGRGHALGVQIRWNAILFSLVDLGRAQVERTEVRISAAVSDAEGYMEELQAAIAAQIARHPGREIWTIGISGPLPIEVPNIPPHDMALSERWPDQSWFRAFFRAVPIEALSRRIGQRFGLPVTIWNNPQSGALAEALTLPPDASFVYVQAGLGLGVCYMRDRALSRDIWRHSGELGHVLYKGRTLSSALSAGSLRHALNLQGGQGEFEADLGRRVAEQPEVFEDWIVGASEVLRFLVNFAENAVWPEGIALGGFMPVELLDRLIDRTAPLADSVVLRDGQGDRRLPRLFRARAGAPAIPFGAAASLLSSQSNPDFPQLIAARRNAT